MCAGQGHGPLLKLVACRLVHSEKQKLNRTPSALVQEGVNRQSETATEEEILSIVRAEEWDET